MLHPPLRLERLELRFGTWGRTLSLASGRWTFAAGSVRRHDAVRTEIAAGRYSAELEVSDVEYDTAEFARYFPGRARQE